MDKKEMIAKYTKLKKATDTEDKSLLNTYKSLGERLVATEVLNDLYSLNVEENSFSKVAKSFGIYEPKSLELILRTYTDLSDERINSLK